MRRTGGQTAASGHAASRGTGQSRAGLAAPPSPVLLRICEKRRQSMAGPGELTCPWFPAHACIPSLPDSAMHCKYQGDELECKWMDSCEKIRPSTHPIRRPEVRAVLCCICMTACMQATFAQRNAMQRGHGWAGLPRVRMNARCLWCVLCVPKSKCRDARVTDGTSRPSQPASGRDPFDCDDIYSNLFFKNKRI